jgi:hypothetical protein
MSTEQVCDVILDLQLKDPTTQSPFNCRYAVGKMAEIADKTDPTVITEILVYPYASPDEDVHYALKVGENIFNPVKAAGFPRYTGPIKKAPGLLRFMNTTKEVL